jgi:hypothetical protein
VANDGGISYNQITVQTAFSNNFRDIAGHGMLLTDETNEILRLGAPDNTIDKDFPGTENKTHNLEIYAKERPNIFLGDGGDAPMANYHLAFLEDLAQSIYFQRDVVLAVDTKTYLDTLKVWVMPDGTIVPPNSEGAQPKDGFYTMDPSAHITSGHLFKKDDTVLIKDSGTKEMAPDGYLNAELPGNTSATYDIKLITGLPEVRVGATVKDTKGVNGIVLGINGDQIEITAVSATVFNYTLPAYITYGDTGWGTLQAIPLPKADPGKYLHDISYEWLGAVGPFERAGSTTPYFEPGYEVWTPHHENPLWDPDGKGDPNPAWSHVHFDLDGYRSAARQDQIDNALEGLVTVQPDYAEMVHTVPFALPEGDEKIIANPAYIHNRPWDGIAVLDGGGFTEIPRVQPNWLVDGGDFTGLNVGTPGYLTPAVPSKNQFRNVIIRLWHGNYADMPELAHDTPATWKNFERTFRWVEDQKALYYSDGEKLYKLNTWEPAVIYPADPPTFTYAATSEFFHEHDGGGYRYKAAGFTAFGGANYGATATGIWYEIYARQDSDNVGARLFVTGESAFLTKGKNDATFAAGDEIVVKSELDTAIAAEVVARDAAIADAIAIEVTNRDAAIAAEATARDNAISTAIATEVIHRNGAITAAIATEVSDRNDAITTAIATEVTNRDAAIATEATARDTAIGAAIATEVTNRDAAIAAEATARDGAIGTAIATEVSNRDAAIAVETTRATTAENAIVTRVPVPPSSLADGQYKLVVTVNSGVLTYTWEVV